MALIFKSLAFDSSYSLDVEWKRREARGSEDAALKSLLYKITTSSPWFRYEKGSMERAECHQILSQQLKLPESEISSGLCAIPQFSLPEGVRDLKADFPDLKFLAVGNGTLDQVAPLQRQLDGGQWPDTRIFASCQLGERLPHSGFIKRLLKESQLESSQVLYVTHIPEHAAAAQTAGLEVLLCPDQAQYASRVRKLYSNPIERGLSFLKGQAGNLNLETSAGKTLQDIFSQFLILDALNDESIVYLPQGSPPFNWLFDNETSRKPVYSKPACVDTNSLGLSVVSHVTMDQRNDIMDQMLALRDSEGIMQVYFSDEVIRQDIGVAINSLSLFNEFGRGEELQATEDWVFDTLRTRAHEYSSHYYTTPDLILFFMSRLLEDSNSCFVTVF
ncbi:uncharacterized protein N7503_012061 [Penicillium pulvis]|uniref:uncharacterized protein n=1 Tax=Penicillium pulvis TaxID=1562058 RepID=UPI002547FA0F|nr:uncharacterized protein N7503_012061 [Penicillium pulvis]KAJ5786849.1 hypothetical protein N7503_012061 [Penicillium pulvis]